MGYRGYQYRGYQYLGYRSRSRRGPLARLALILALVLVAFGPIAQSSVTAQESDQGAVRLTGKLEMPPEVFAQYAEPYVMLVDLASTLLDTGELPPVQTQVAAGLIDRGNANYAFELSLPIEPLGTPLDLIDGEEVSSGPQLYSVNVVANLFLDPFLTEPDGFGGNLPTLLSSITTDEEGSLVGQLVVWAPEAGMEFPSGAGDDGVPLTDDDPTDELEAGWTVVELSNDDYDFMRTAEVEIGFPGDAVSPNDLSNLTFTEAFDALVDQLEVIYPFTDLKDIDFDELRETYRPLIEEAEATDDADAFTAAIYAFSLEFHDGHVASTLPVAELVERYGGGIGIQLGETDEGQVFVIDVAEDSPADAAGIEVGAEIIEWNGQDVSDAIDEVPLAMSASSEHSIRSQQVRLLSRSTIGDEVEIVYANPGEEANTEDLRFVGDIDGLLTAISSANPYNDAAMPVEVSLLPSGVGYIRITSFSEDTVLFGRQWDYAINTLTELGATGLIVDVRSNGGGQASQAFYASGSFNDEPFVLDTAYVANSDGEFVEAYDEINPVSPVQWDSGPVAVLIDDWCASACEQFAASMAATSDDIMLIGYTPTGGVYAAIDTWTLPAGVDFQASYVRYHVDGEIFLEGEGVPPTVDVEVTEETLLADEDVLLEIAEDQVLDAA